MKRLRHVFAAVHLQRRMLVSECAIERFDGLGAIVICTVLAVGGAVFVGRACDAELRRAALPRWAGLLGHWAMIPTGVLLGLFANYGALSIINDYRITGIAPAIEPAVGYSLLGVAGVFALATWAVLFWRRREHARLGL